MGWANCGEDSTGRPIGHAHEAVCDEPGCDERIDRGLSYACGGMHGNETAEGGESCCGGYFCGEHLGKHTPRGSGPVAREDLVIYVAGALSDLEDMGLIQTPAGSAKVSPKGLARYDQLRASGYRPARTLVAACLYSMFVMTNVRYPAEVVVLISKLDGIKKKHEETP